MVGKSGKRDFSSNEGVIVIIYRSLWEGKDQQERKKITKIFSFSFPRHNPKNYSLGFNSQLPQSYKNNDHVLSRMVWTNSSWDSHWAISKHRVERQELSQTIVDLTSYL